MIFPIYPINLPVAFPPWYTLDSLVLITIPSLSLLESEANFSSFESISTIGTKCSGLVFLLNFSIIVSKFISKTVAISFIFSSLFSKSNIDGCIPTTLIVPFSANTTPFLSSILPLLEG